MTWEYDGYIFKDGWFLSEFDKWNGHDVLKFSADGLTQTVAGLPGITIATNWIETRKDTGNWGFANYFRPTEEGDKINFDLNEDSALIKGIQDHPITFKPALTQGLDREVEGITWLTSNLDDIVTINANSYQSSVKTVNVDSFDGNDDFIITGYIGLLTGCGSAAGVWLDAGDGYDTLTLEGKLSDYDIKIGGQPEGFKIKKRGVGGCSDIHTIDLESIKGKDFEWIYGEDSPRMGKPIDREPGTPSEGKEAIPNSPTITNNYITNIVNNITNVTNNVTTTNISNSGSGNITVGNIGTVNNTTTIDNSFTIQTTNINLSLAITGDSKKSEKVEGTDGDDLIADGRGKDKLIGGDGADQFYFSGEEPFKKKTVDKVIDFDSSEGDAIVIADEVVGDLTEDPTLAIADTKKELKQLSKDGYDLLYFEPKGDLYVDGNGDSKGFGKKSEGGMIADLPNETILTESDVLIGV